VAGAPAFQLNIAALLPKSLSQAGSSFRGVVAELEGALVIRANGATIPIATNAGLTAGQQVAVHVLTGGANPQIQVSPLSLVVSAEPQAVALVQPAGSQVVGEIVAQGGKLSFVHGKVSIPLPTNQNLFVAGDRAVFQSQATTNGFQTSLSPASSGTTLAMSTNSTTSIGVAYTASPSTVPTAGSIPVPAPLIGTPAAAQVQELFTQAASLGAGIAGLQASIAAPAVVAAVPSDIGAAFAAIFAPLLRPESDDFPGVIKRWAQRLATTPEAALAKGGGTGAAVPDTPGSVLQFLRNDPALRQVLAARGELRAFDAMADRLLERLGGGSLQQLRSLEQPYWFSEFPFDPASGIERALVHFFMDDSRGGGDREAPSASVVLDLSLTRLGDVWVKLVMLAGQCTCHISVTDEDVLALVQEFEEDLAAGLASTGAQHVSVHADLWDGNRIGRSGAILGSMDGMDVTA